jgi:hypothetical protein
MPLVTITTQQDRVPAETSDLDTPLQTKTAAIGAALPRAFLSRKSALLLDEDTPPEAVQVDFKSYHPRAINAADIWFLIIFTEMPPSENAKHRVREAIKAIVVLALSEQGLLGKARYATDIQWAGGTGFLEFGDVTSEW